MLVTDLDFYLPADRIALFPTRPSRVLWKSRMAAPVEVTPAFVLEQIQEGDAVVINDTKVLRRRIFTPAGEEILFLKSLNSGKWEVLFPSKHLKVGDSLALPGGRRARLATKGLPQVLEVEDELTEDFFTEYGEMPLPPYIQDLRETRHNSPNEEMWYQTAWAEKPGSLASPTASLHFSSGDFDDLRAKGVSIETLTLHVGLGTFAPVKTPDLNDHKMHAEMLRVEPQLRERLLETRRKGRKVWALGTTVVRALESDVVEGETSILIAPPYQFKYVDVLMTNFHQPKSTLLALVMAFAGQDSVRDCYRWALENRFRFLSYGDLSVWT